MGRSRQYRLHALLTVVVLLIASSLIAEERQLNFANDIVPLLSRYGCNSSACHGKAEGQNGFKLSVFGFDPPADYDALTKEGRGRRVFPAAAQRSLLLAKASGGLPHGGGVRIPADSHAYRTLHDWIAAGVPFGKPDDPHVESIQLTPREQVLGFRGQQQLRVIAHYSDGRDVDVTPLARFQSNNEGLASVDESGLVTAGETPGQVAIMASFLETVDVFQALVPRESTLESLPHELAEHNFIDRLIYDKLRKLNIAPSAQADDAAFLRRVYLDTIGTLPTAAEARRFLDDRRPDRRERLVEELLVRPEFADYWSLWWSDLLRVDRQALGHKGAYALYNWIRQSLADNKPLDRLTREIVTAEGPLAEAPAGYFYQAMKKPGEMASTLSQVFLGVRIACAECHHHPFDRWSQDDYYGMQAFFAPLSRKKSPLGEVLLASAKAEAKNPRSGQTIYPHALATARPREAPSGDPRGALADWIVSPDNPWFARNLANRLWAHFLGRGLVEPVDDLRLTNPPTNAELLDALAAHLIECRYDVRAFLRTLTASAAYQRSCEPNESNQRDEQNYSRALFKRIPAEVLLDAVCQTTGVSEKFDGMPAGYRAIQVWDSQVPHYFLKLFGRPQRHTVCECERNTEASIAQVLHLMNSPQVQEKLSHAAGNLARWAREIDDDARLVEEIYLAFYSRYPTSPEREAAIEHLRTSSAGRRAATEDLAWGLLNSLEFVFNR
jgi:hypothetical protein